MTTLDRYRGCLLGLAAGDALGTTLEFKQPGIFEPLTDMVGGGPFDLQAGRVDRRHEHGACASRRASSRGASSTRSTNSKPTSAGGATGT